MVPPLARGAFPKGGNLHGSPDRSNLFGSHGQRPWFNDELTIEPSAGQEAAFTPCKIEIPVDTGFLALIDAVWESRGVSSKQLEQDVLDVFSAHQPLSLMVEDQSGKPAGVVVATGHGDGIYSIEVTATKLIAKFD